MDSFTLNYHEKVNLLKILSSSDSLTPLLRKEVLNTIHLYESDAPVEAIEHCLDQVQAHWEKFYSNPYSRTFVFYYMNQFKLFLEHKLLEDYAEQPYTGTEWVSTQTGISKAHRAGDTNTPYQHLVVWPLQELMVDEDHAVDMILAVGSGSRVQHLMRDHDWKSLDATLRKDYDLAISLFKCTPVSVFNRRKILGGIDRIRNEFSVHIQAEGSAPSGFRQTINRFFGWVNSAAFGSTK